MKHLLFISIIICFTACGGGDTTPGATANSNTPTGVKAEAEKMSDLLLKKDYEGFITYTHPEVVKLGGGADSLLQTLKKGAIEMEDSGVKFTSVTIGNPSKIITKGSEMQCTIPQTLYMRIPGGSMKTEGTLVGISPDGGKRWYFVDGGGRTLAELQQVLPNLSNELVIPPKKEPEVTED